MRVRSNSSISPPSATGGAPAAKAPEPRLQPLDGVQISGASSALDQTAKVHELTAAVGAGAYESSSVATSHALVEDALSENF